MAAQQANAQWEQLCANTAAEANSQPSQRSSHSISIVGDNMYAFGGEHVARTPINSDMHVFDLVNRAWSLAAPSADSGAPPGPRVAHSQACIVTTADGSTEHTIYIFGGRQSITMEEAPLQDLYSFQVSTNTWTEVTPSDASGPPPCSRSFHKMAAVGTTLYVFGGCGVVGRLADLYAFDTVACTWTQLASSEAITGRGGAGFCAAPDGAALFVIGGFSGKEMNDVFRYDIKTDAWTTVLEDGNDAVEPFSVSSCGVLQISAGPALVFFGGEVNPSEKGHEGAGGFGNHISVFNGGTGEALVGAIEVSKETIPAPRGWSAAGTWGPDSSLVVFGGLTGDDTTPERLNDVWVLKASK